ncbi:family 20 glycosylhydrolase [Alloiococcus sp. CFN-8]|uniref:family 20 glycosylhydrolase n=1 Tax=Alloiococcus sp. CFN-8 TaxID=3416081 RepID=UPI003CE8A0E1
MFLIPKPKDIQYKEERFNLGDKLEITLGRGCSLDSLEGARLLKEELWKALRVSGHINRSFSDQVDNNILLLIEEGRKESYSLRIEEKGIRISGGDEAGLFYGIQTLRQIIKQSDIFLQGLVIYDEPYFKNRGFYHDITRGKVPEMETLKELVDRLAFYKINHLELYIEHTFAFKGFSEAWRGKDPLTSEDIIELDAYCKKRNIELVPSLSMFGHLYELLSTRGYEHLSELDVDHFRPFSWIDRMNHHTLDVSNEDSLALIDNMLKEFIPLFTSNKFNICCDETFDLGKGKNKALLESIGSGRMYTDFLKKIISMVESYGKEVLFWGDIILKYPEYLNELPKGVTCLNWNYSGDATEEGTRIIASYDMKQYLCPGVGGWNKLINDFDSSFNNINKMINYGKKYKAEGILNTDWGDYGHINPLGGSIPGMIYGASLAWNPQEDENFDFIDSAISLIEYGDSRMEIVGILRELSREHIFDWTHFNIWRERELHDKEWVAPWLEKIKDMQVEDIIKGYYNSLEISSRLRSKFKDIDSSKNTDLEEFIVASVGIALLNASCLSIRRFSLGFGDSPLIMDNITLGKELELWMEDYSRIWRKRNKESELFRLKKCIYSFTDYLRDVSK